MKKQTLPKLTKKAQTVFNAWIRQRDAELGCISCGGSVDHAGHYFAAGSYSAWRFSESNVHGQCVGCNCYKHGNLIHYRIGLVQRFGEESVKALESAVTGNRLKKWSRVELEEIIKKYS